MIVFLLNKLGCFTMPKYSKGDLSCQTVKIAQYANQQIKF